MRLVLETLGASGPTGSGPILPFLHTKDISALFSSARFVTVAYLDTLGICTGPRPTRETAKVGFKHNFTLPLTPLSGPVPPVPRPLQCVCPFQNDVVIKVDDLSDIELQENIMEVEDPSEKPTHDRYIRRSSSVESTRSSIVRVNVIVSVCSQVSSGKSVNCSAVPCSAQSHRYTFVFRNAMRMKVVSAQSSSRFNKNKI